MTITMGIDASRNRSGGARAHLIGLIGKADPEKYGIEKIHLWAYRELLDHVPDRPWLIKHSPKSLERSLLSQILWQRLFLHREATRLGCSIVLNTDAGSVSSFRPCITMSRDMLSYEPGEIERYGFSKARVRLILLRYIQNQSLKNSDGAIFLTSYAAQVIQKSCGAIDRVAYVPHGVGDRFKALSPTRWPLAGDRPIRCLYVSNAALYKHQWVVIRAIELLRKQGYPLELTLVGGGGGPGSGIA